MLDDPCLRFLRSAVISAPGHILTQNILRYRIFGDPPAVGLSVLIMGVLEAMDCNVGLHLETGDHRIEALQPIATEPSQPFQILGQRRPLPE